MNPVLESVISTKTFVNGKNETITIHSETSKEKCVFLQQLISKNKCKRSLEIGFAYGISTLAILEEITSNGGCHFVIDKFQTLDWGGNGLELVKKAGYIDSLEFEEEYCYSVLPKLLEQGRIFDFVYIDSTKQLDWLLMNFFYIDKLLSINGIIVFDDVPFPGIRKLLRYIVQFPNYSVHSQFPSNKPPSSARRLAGILKLLPGAKHIIKEEILNSDFKLGINASAVALIKIGEDTRNWEWHKPF
ncbi:MAG: class I SAM-dependent methyltransferase [Ferruginibacter sp.]